MGYNLDIFHLQVGYKPFTTHLLTSWDIQVGNWNGLHVRLGLSGSMVIGSMAYNLHGFSPDPVLNGVK